MGPPRSVLGLKFVLTEFRRDTFELGSFEHSNFNRFQKSRRICI